MPRRRGQEEEAAILSCNVPDVSYIASLLRAVAFKKRSWFIASTAGLRVCVEVGRSVQAHAFLQAELFAGYTYTAPDDATPGPDGGDEHETSFEIDLSIVLECLNIFGSSGTSSVATRDWKGKGKRREDRSDDEDRDRPAEQPQYARRDKDKRTAMRLSYAGLGHPLVMLLEEGGIVTRCEIITLDPEPMLDLPFEDEQRVVKVIMKSEFFRDAISELDSSSERMTFTFTPPPKKRKRPRGDEGTEEAVEGDANMRVEAVGNQGSAEMDFPYDRDVIEVFNCHDKVQNSYPLASILHAKAALSSSTKTSIRMDTQGLMSLQFMMPSQPGGASGFVELLCVPVDDEE